MAKALAREGDPHLTYPTLHVGGTNGKGSVASTWASVLRQDGRRVGLYTSPHLCSFRERIVISGKALSAERLAQTADRLQPLTHRLGMSLFEAATLLALVVFAEERVDVACIEVGLGGRLDATNVIRPQVAAITNVALDHQDYLGESLAEIAHEKAGIIKAGVPIVTAADRPVVLKIFREHAQKVGTSFHQVEPWHELSALHLGPDGTRFRLHSQVWGELELATPLPGAHQAVNAALAVRALELLPEPPSRKAVLTGVASVWWPGRGQIHQLGDSLFVFDVAHNTASARALARLLADLSPPRPLVLLVGILGDKDWDRMLPSLIDLADEVVFTVPSSAPAGRGWDPNAVATTVGGGIPITVIPEVGQAVAKASAQAQGGTTVVTGSCYTVGDALGILGVSPFAGL